jgi:ferredoxin/flavodoxin---NADP+ reductase
MPEAGDKFLTATVTSRRDLSDDLWVIRVDPGGPFPFKAGQYATLGVAASTRLIERAYSIVSSPYEPELEFFIELVHEGELTPPLYRLNVGDTLSLRKSAKGRFMNEAAAAPADHLFLCTVTGVAPLLSLVRTLSRDWSEGGFKGDHRLFVIQGASRSSEFGYRDEIERFAGDLPWLTYVPTVSRPWDDPEWQGETGRVDDVIRKYADQWGLRPDRAFAHLCGHPSMIEHGKAILGRAGWPKNRLKEESYFILKPAAE